LNDTPQWPFSRNSDTDRCVLKAKYIQALEKDVRTFLLIKAACEEDAEGSVRKTSGWLDEPLQVDAVGDKPNLAWQDAQMVNQEPDLVGL
jgi:hypothetical protein